jgi:type I restriction enzyme S subunit
MSEVNFPEGWAKTKVIDIADINPKKIDADPEILSGFIPMSHAPTDFNGALSFDEKPWGDIKKSYTNFKDNDVIVAKVTPCFENGKAAIVHGLPSGIGAGSSEFYVIRPAIKEVSTHFLFSIVKSHKFLQEGAENMTGAVGLRRVPRVFVENFAVALPPLAEQKVIANKLDTLLTQVETTKARLDRIPKILKTFRQSVLASAVSGKFTEEWRKQSQSEWSTAKCKLGDLVELAYGKSLPAKTRSGDGYPVYGSNGAVGLHREFLVEAPFIIVGRKGSYGEITWSDDNGWPIDTTYFVNLRQQSDLKFVYFLLQTLGLNQLNRSTAIPGLNREDAYSQEIVVPSVKEQIQIVHRVEELFAFADRIEQKANAALERVNNLTQSILAKAFRGELTTDWRDANPDLISGDNSAKALLERIKAEREVLKKQPKTKSTVKKKTGRRMSKRIIKVVDALKEAGKPLSGQQLLAAAGYPSDSSTDQLETFFLDIREALTTEKSIVKLERNDDGQDWFALAEADENKKA